MEEGEGGQTVGGRLKMMNVIVVDRHSSFMSRWRGGRGG